MGIGGIFLMIYKAGYISSTLCSKVGSFVQVSCEDLIEKPWIFAGVPYMGGALTQGPFLGPQYSTAPL